MDNVVKQVSELATFTKLFKKYKLVDYDERAKQFYEVYGRQHLDDLPAALKQWEGKEEMFLQSLVLENGPEPADLDLKRRLIAFSEHHNQPLNIEQLVAQHKDSPEMLFRKLVSEYGLEPDPRTYLYPPSTYTHPEPPSLLPPEEKKTKPTTPSE